MKSCEFCSSNGFNHHLPRLNPSWKGWESQSPLDGLKMMSDEDGLYVVCNDCLVVSSLVFDRGLAVSRYKYPLR